MTVVPVCPRGHRLAAVAAATVLAIFGLSGCSGEPPWAVPDSSASPSASSVPVPVPNDLSSGSTQRTLTAGPVTATIDYWSTLNMAEWTPEAIKPVSISLITTVTPADGQKVFLQRATMLAVPGTLDEDFDALAPQIDQATSGVGYLVLDPYSYSQTFNVGPVPAESQVVTLHFTYEFLVQATPTSNEYAKQTATDTLTVAISPPAPPPD